jgi:C4-dicarboxylate transporter DctQ subunit
MVQPPSQTDSRAGETAANRPGLRSQSWAGHLIALPGRLLLIASYSTGLVSGFAVLIMAALISAQVISRQVFHRVFIDTVQLGELAVVVMTFLGLAWVYRLGRHVSVRLLVQRLHWRTRLWVEIVSLSIALVGLLVVMYQAWSFAYSSLLLGERLRGLMRIDAFPFHVLMPLGFGLMSLEVVRTIVLDFQALRLGMPELSPTHTVPQDDIN